MSNRVYLLGELVVLLYADFAALKYRNNNDLSETLRQLPRVGFAAALIWAVFFFMADAGAGGIAAILGLLITLSFVMRYYPDILGSINQYLGISGSPV